MNLYLADLATRAIVELVKSGLSELMKRGIDLGPVGFSASDFKAVDEQIDARLKALKIAEDESRHAMLSHILFCEFCLNAWNELILALERGEDKRSEELVRAIISAHDGHELQKVQNLAKLYYRPCSLCGRKSKDIA